jgi:hypothetical protein
MRNEDLAQGDTAVVRRHQAVAVHREPESRETAQRVDQEVLVHEDAAGDLSLHHFEELFPGRKIVGPLEPLQDLDCRAHHCGIPYWRSLVRTATFGM